MKVGRRKGLALRAGFTLVELLVVISIIGMLMALLFPAINAARESGRQNTCRSNMRNIALAIHGYETKKTAYPMIANLVRTQDGTQVPRSLMFVILPELERMDITTVTKNTNWDNADLEAANLYLEIVQCPSNPLVRQGANAENMAFVFNVGRFGFLNSASTTTSSLDPADGIPERYAGMFFEAGSPNSSADLTAGDGATNTLLISENLTGSRWIDITEGTVGFTWVTGSTSQGINQDKTTPGLAPTANHPGLVNVAFADAHVRTLNEAIDYPTYRQLCTPSGSQFGMTLLNEGDY